MDKGEKPPLDNENKMDWEWVDKEKERDGVVLTKKNYEFGLEYRERVHGMFIK
ncbi:MAG: hypothetical protein ABDH37_03150 [Candidatus Hydrothermales bacterium]